MNNQKPRIYQVTWRIKALEQLTQLNLPKKEAEQIIQDVYEILSINPYGKFAKKFFKVNYDIKKLRANFAGQWRLRIKENYQSLMIKDYRIVYEVSESKVLVKIFNFEHRETVYLDKNSSND